MNAEIVRATHVAMHHESYRKQSALARIEDHRTDGRRGRSTAFHNFDPGLLDEMQRLIADIGDLKDSADPLPQAHLPKVDHLTVSFQAWRSTYLQRDCRHRLVGPDQQRSNANNQHAAQQDDWKW